MNQDREMHAATCSECGADTEVPFKPDPDRPVYCRDCYSKRRKNRGGFGGGRDSGAGGEGDNY